MPDCVYPVIPESTPVEERTKVGVLIKLVNPVADSKLMPFRRLVLLFVAAVKSIPLRVLVLLVLVALVSERVVPLTVVAVLVVFALVIPSTCPDVALVPDENIWEKTPFPDARVKLVLPESVVLLLMERVPVVLPIETLPVPVVARLTFDAPVVPKLVKPVEERVVNAPEDAIVSPISVALIPVEVVLKLLDVTKKLLLPVSKVTPESPVALTDPEVAVRERGPVV